GAGDEGAYVAVADRLEQPAQALRVLVARREQDDVALGLDDPGGARADSAVGHRHVQCPGRVGRVELARVAAVDQRRAVLQELEGALRCELDELSSLARRITVQLYDALEVRRLRLEFVGDAIDELLLVEAE